MLLIGIKKIQNGGTSVPDVDGNIVGVGGGQSSIFDILKEGDRHTLKAFVESTKKEGEKVKKEFSKLEEELNFGKLSIPLDEYYDKELEYDEKTKILKYDKLLIIEGEIL